MNAIDEERRAFHFDLDEDLLRQWYPSKSGHGYKMAWSKVRAFMESNGFEHAQYSGYESKEGMSLFDALETIARLSEAFPWFLKCARVATITTIGPQYDALAYIRHQGDEPVVPGTDAGQGVATSLDTIVSL